MSAETETTLAGMSLEQQIGQIFMAGFDGLEPTPEIVDLIQRRHVGGVILFTRNISDTRQTLALTRELQHLANEAGHPYPLLIAIDQENGLVRRLGPDSTAFPGNMALGAIGDEDVAFDVAHATGEELHSLGINMNLAPVADINTNPENPVIGVRSFGEDPELVSKLVAASVRGYSAAGVIATLKHFPGHGDTASDSHKALPVVPFGVERLNQVELKPFWQGIAAGAECVMSAHILLPEIDPELPATISPQVMQGLLRAQLGFDGVAMTDCLEMDAISEGVGVANGAVLAITAGMDLVLISHRYDRQIAGIDAVLGECDRDDSFAANVKMAAERVMRLKARYLTWDEALSGGNDDIVGSGEHRRISEQAYARSITLVRNIDSLLPLRLSSEQKILVIGPSQQNVSVAVDLAFRQDAFVDEIRKRHENVESIIAGTDITITEHDNVLNAVRSADITILVTINAHRDPEQAALAWAIVETRAPVIGLAAGDPYDAQLFPDLGACLVTYEYTAPALRAAVPILFGEAEASGHLPITLAIPGV